MRQTLNFARRPFADERSFLFAAGLAVAIGVVLLFVNVRQWSDFHRQIEGTALQIESLQQRRDRATSETAQSRAVIDSYRVSSLATQSKELLKLVAERRFSWTGLLARLERTLPADVRVTRLMPRFDKEGMVIECSLVGRSHDSVAQTITALVRDPVFETVDLRSETSPEAAGPGGVDGFEFELVLRYLKGGIAP